MAWSGVLCREEQVGGGGRKKVRYSNSNKQHGKTCFPRGGTAAGPSESQLATTAALLQSLRGTMHALAAQAARNKMHDSQWIAPPSDCSRRAQL